MKHIHIIYSEKDRQAAFFLSCRLKRYYLHHPKIDSASVILNSEDFTDDPSVQNYLIVICSLHTADDVRLTESLLRFSEKVPQSHIIPYVIGGQPHTKDPKNECLLPLLRDASHKDLLAVNSIELGKRTALHSVISTIHNIPMNTLEQRSKQQKIRRWIFTVAVTILFLSYSAYSEYTTTTHTEYFRSYTYVFGVPTGIDRLGFAERLSCKDYYIFRVHHHTPLSVQRVGAPPPITVTDSAVQAYYDAIDTPIAVYSYHTDGTLDSAVHKDTDGNILFVINYLANNAVADFSELPDSITPYFLTLDGQKSNASRCLFEYDEEGAVSGIHYLSGSAAPY